MRSWVIAILLCCCAACYRADNSTMYGGLPEYKVSIHWKDSTALLHTDSITLIPVGVDTSRYFELLFKLIRGKAENYKYKCSFIGVNAENVMATDTSSFMLGYTHRNRIFTGHVAIDDTVILAVVEQSSGQTQNYRLVFRVR